MTLREFVEKHADILSLFENPELRIGNTHTYMNFTVRDYLKYIDYTIVRITGSVTNIVICITDSKEVK